ncbi:MAG: hypothetical protein ACYCSW_08905 [bacterium]
MKLTENKNLQMQEGVKDKINRIAVITAMKLTENKNLQMQEGVKDKINRIAVIDSGNNKAIAHNCCSNNLFFS